MPPIRVLCVDDELAIQQMMPSVLGLHGFDVTSVGTVAEALAEIVAHTFDVLIADLNIGEPGTDSRWLVQCDVPIRIASTSS
jgi:CheY-like chemotaxis protein